MALDAGTGSGRCVIFDEDGNQIATGQREWMHKTIPEYPGSMVFDTDENWRLLRECIKEALTKSKIQSEDIAGISATSMREGIVLYDKEGNEMWACPNVDARAGEEASVLIEKGLAEAIYFKSGHWPNIITPPRILWIKKHQPNIYKKIAHMTMLSDWALYRLSGVFSTDPSNGASSGMFDIAKRTWSEEIAEISGLPKEVLPEVYESGTVIGEVTRKAAQETGLKEGTPVVTGGGDTQLGIIGIGGVKPFQNTLIGGSFWQQTIIVDKPIIDKEERLRTQCHVVPGQFYIEGIGFYCGIAMRWFRDAFCEQEKNEAKKRNVDPYNLLEKKAENVPPGSNGVLAIVSDIMNVKKWLFASPTFTQFDLMAPERSGKKECFRALEENAAYVSRGSYEIIWDVVGFKPDKSTKITFCGGAAKGFLWPQIVSDVLGIPLMIPIVKEATALGTAICAGVGVGIYDDISRTSAQIVRWEREIQPNKSDHDKYTQYYNNWRKIYPRFLKIVEDGLLEPMYRAPGV